MPRVAPEAYEIVGRYNSTRTPSNIYEVRRYVSKGLWCSCHGWRFRRACRHVTRVEQGLDDDAATAEKVARRSAFEAVLTRAQIRLATDSPHLVNVHRPGSDAHAEAAGRLLDALDASGLFLPRDAPLPSAGRSRGARLITLDD